MKNLFNKNFFFVLLVFCILCGCNNNGEIYHKYQTIGTKGWNKSDTLIFTADKIDSAQNVNLYAEIRHTRNYPYSDLYIVIKQNLSDSLNWQTDTLRFQLANNNGSWLGKGLGNYYADTRRVRSIKLSAHAFKASIRVSHGMKDSELKGITDIGFRIE